MKLRTSDWCYIYKIAMFPIITRIGRVIVLHSIGLKITGKTPAPEATLSFNKKGLQ